MNRVVDQLLQSAKSDSAFWRRMAWAGVQYGPEAWVRYSPPAIGVAFWAALSAPRENVIRTLQKVRGPSSRAHDLAQSASVFANFASCLTEALLVGADRGYRADVLSQNDGAHFKRAFAEDKGVILATAHTAGWDVAGPMLSELQRDAEVVIVMSREEDARARQMQDAARTRAGVRIMHVGDDPLASLPLLHHLRRKKGLVAMKFDRTASGQRTRSARFLGEPWTMPEGILTLAAVSGAPIIPVFTRRLGFMRYEWVTAPPLHVGRRPSPAELDASAQHLARLLEEFVRENPSQWFRWWG